MTVDVGQAAVDAVVIKAETLVIEAEKMQRGGVQVVGVGRVFGGLESEFVGAAVSRAAANASACEPDGKRSGIVVPAFTLAGRYAGANFNRSGIIWVFPPAHFKKGF